MDELVPIVAKFVAKPAAIVGAGILGGPIAAAAVSASFNSVSLIKNLDEENYVSAALDAAFLVADVASIATPLATTVKSTSTPAVVTTKSFSRPATQGWKTTKEVAKSGVTVRSKMTMDAVKTTVNPTVQKTTMSAAGEITKTVTATKCVETFSSNAIYQANTKVVETVTKKTLFEKGGQEFVKKTVETFVTETTKATPAALATAKNVATYAGYANDGRMIVQKKDEIIKKIDARLNS